MIVYLSRISIALLFSLSLTLDGSVRGQDLIKKWSVESQQTLKALDALVALSGKDNDSPSRQWHTLATKQAYRALEASGKCKNDPTLARYFKQREAAWLRVKKLGIEFIDMHHMLKQYAKELKQNNEDVRRSIHGFTTQISKFESPAKDIITLSKELEKLLEASKPVLDPIQKATGQWSTLKNLVYPVQVVVAKFRANQKRFFKHRGAARDHLDKMNKIIAERYTKLSEGRIFDFEKRWDEALQKAYYDYEDGLDEYKQLEKQYSEEEFLKIVNSAASSVVALSTTIFFGAPLPSFPVKSLDQLTDYIDKAKHIWRRHLMKDLTQTVQEIADEQGTLQEEINLVKAKFRADLDAMELEIGQQFDRVAEEVENDIEGYESAIAALDKKISGAGASSAASDALVKRDALYDSIKKEEFRLTKARRHYHVTEKAKRTEALHDALIADIKELNAKHEELERKKRQYQ